MEILNKKILIVDDEVQILNLIEDTLRAEGFQNLYFAKNKTNAIEEFKQHQPHMAILDILLPDGSGFEIINYIRKTSNIPVLFLSALADMENQYEGFNLGADDYMVKPFLAKELVLRIKAILNRTYGTDRKILNLEDSKIDFEKAIVIKEGVEFELTAKEYKILRLLYENKNKIVTIDGILNSVWGEEYFGYENSLMAHIRKIREKIEKNPSKPKSLVTYKGLGYKLRVNL
ncbi:response regulator transcription factor [Anaerosphaera multitolerans]|uniref:DNA-binding response regulator n=1 Tax=Anaerosphaera multitolerans TaxID=2487351 RepID=A0A437S9N7_9FIRM|nr:response regulator transcription factor [Anaerosphaera multitolerans]RVU55554.1 DNA-binding response regulator [Anaerosphaera multitolerans]